MRYLNAIIALLTAVLLTGCKAASPSGGKPLSLWVISDLHYLSPELYRIDSASFQQLLSTNDGKMIEEMPKVTEEFVSLAAEEKPDAVLVPGDLTMNGEYRSLLDLKALFQNLMNAGIPVLVIPGNHDIAYGRAFDLNGDTAFGVREISQADFQEVMGEFGCETGRSHAPDSFSYVYELTDDVWIMAVDANTEQAPGSITDTTLSWAEKELRYAKENNIRVISMTHQNVLKQSEFLYYGYLINNAPSLEHLLNSSGVSLNLSGHSHLQHTSASNGLTDICTESAAVWPLGFGVLDIAEDHKECTYTKREFKTVDQEAARARLDKTLNRMIAPALQEYPITEEQKQIMTEFASSLNCLYYTGQITDSTPFINSEGWKLWSEYAYDSRYYPYFLQILEEFRPS